MKRKSNHKKYLRLREQFQFFEYQSYSFQRKKQKLEAEFVFNLSDKYLFKPTIIVPLRKFYTIDQLTNTELDTIVFHIGMIELISYWKTACPPKIIVRPFNLDKDQVNWWKKLYFNGLGEFFYLNGIEADPEEFVKIESQGKQTAKLDFPLNTKSVVVPVGGGKDSIVSLELLNRSGMKVLPMVINPREASKQSIETAGNSLEESIVVERKLDPLLLRLNDEGFLNGHTPFSALLAFVTVLASAISGIGNIALSNESSASESTVPGTNINHQYSKSFEFEEDFNWYLKRYIHPDMHYFSFLRPLNELQIASLFSGFPAHFESFRSCNVGSKTNSWCGHCPKCLFTWIILSPFLTQSDLQNIFGKNLLEDESLVPVLDELTGRAEIKPFECVGTTTEVRAAIVNAFEPEKLKISSPLISHFFKTGFNLPGDDFNKLLKQFDTNNLIPDNILPILKDALKK